MKHKSSHIDYTAEYTNVYSPARKVKKRPSSFHPEDIDAAGLKPQASLPNISSKYLKQYFRKSKSPDPIRPYLKKNHSVDDDKIISGLTEDNEALRKQVTAMKKKLRSSSTDLVSPEPQTSKKIDHSQSVSYLPAISMKADVSMRTNKMIFRGHIPGSNSKSKRNNMFYVNVPKHSESAKINIEQDNTNLNSDYNK